MYDPNQYTNKWWGYYHQNGTIAVKRFWGTTDCRMSIKEAKSSEFVVTIFPPFDAKDRDEAFQMIQKGLIEEIEESLKKKVKGKAIKLFKDL